MSSYVRFHSMSFGLLRVHAILLRFYFLPFRFFNEKDTVRQYGTSCLRVGL